MIRLHLHHNPPPAIKGYRVCPACKRKKTTDRFYPKRTGEKRCIQCAQKGYKPPEKPKVKTEYGEKAAHEVVTVADAKGLTQCSKCRKWKPATEYYKSARTRQCKECHRRKARQKYDRQAEAR